MGRRERTKTIERRAEMVKRLIEYAQDPCALSQPHRQTVSISNAYYYHIHKAQWAIVPCSSSCILLCQCYIWICLRSNHLMAPANSRGSKAATAMMKNNKQKRSETKWKEKKKQQQKNLKDIYLNCNGAAHWCAIILLKCIAIYQTAEARKRSNTHKHTHTHSNSRVAHDECLSALIRGLIIHCAWPGRHRFGLAFGHITYFGTKLIGHCKRIMPRCLLSF